MAAVAPAFLLAGASAAVGAVGAVGAGSMQAQAARMQGQEQSMAAQFEQRQHEIAEQQNRTAAAQAEARRREELAASIETVQALRAGRGVGAGSPTGMAILGDMVSDTESDIATERANYMTRADQNRVAALLSARRARTSLIAGEMGARAARLDTFTKVAGLGTNLASMWMR